MIMQRDIYTAIAMRKAPITCSLRRMNEMNPQWGRRGV